MKKQAPFQNARAVFEHFIPEYKPDSDELLEDDIVSVQAGQDISEGVLAELRKTLATIPRKKS
jgi:hypothetical protein